MDSGVVRVGRFKISVTVVQQETSDSGAIPIIKRTSPIESISTKREITERSYGRAEEAAGPADGGESERRRPGGEPEVLRSRCVSPLLGWTLSSRALPIDGKNFGFDLGLFEILAKYCLKPLILFSIYILFDF